MEEKTMNTQEIWYLSSLIIFIALMIGISYAVSRNSSAADFTGANSKFGGLIVGIVCVGAFIGGAGLVGLTGWCYGGGLGIYLGYAISYLLTLPFIWFFMPKIKKLNMHTPTQFFQTRYSKYNSFIRYPIGSIYTFRNAAVLGVQLNALAFMLKVFFGWSHTTGVIVSAIFVVVYISISGLMSVMVTSFIQAMFQIVTPIVTFVILLTKAGGWAKVVDYHEVAGTITHLNLLAGIDWWNDVFYYALTFGLMLIFIGEVSDWQRVGVSKDVKSASKGLYIGTFGAIPLLLFSGLIGVSAKVVLGAEMNGNMVFYEIVRNVFSAPVGAILIAGIMSTILSCTSAFLFAGAANISQDIMIPLVERNGKKVTQEEEVKYTRIGIVIVAIIAACLSIAIPGIMDLLLFSAIVVSAGLIVPYVFGWFSKKMNTEGAIAGLITGTIAAVVWKTLGNPFGVDYLWAGIGMNIIGCLVFAALFPAPAKEDVDAVYYFGEQFKEKETEVA